MDDLEFIIPKSESSIIKVIGVGGGGSNAVNQMIEMEITGVDFVVCNTDEQALRNSPAPIKIQLGTSLTEGRGAGNNPAKGREAAIENIADIEKILDDNTKMIFITAGMGGGTGTGAAPVIAEAAKKRDILTIAIVSIPFKVEGELRINQAIEGINKLKESVDSLLIINNEKLQNIYHDLKMSNAFTKADDVLAIATKGIAEIITVHGYINVDFEDVKTVMKDSGVALMGSARASGENRDVTAIKAALDSPLLKDNDIKGSKNILLNIMSAPGENELSMNEFGIITSYLKEVVGKDANVIWGTGHDEKLGDEINVTIIATGFEALPGLYENEKPEKEIIRLKFGDTLEKVEDNDTFDEIKPIDNNNNNQNIDDDDDEKSVELELDFDKSIFDNDENDDENMPKPNTDPNNYKHLKDIDRLNDSFYLDELEDQPAIQRKNNNTTED
ncbi:MAG: cell division protein FtsZ [Bacteroidales bacterium]|nr:cell division protein FtsZ [Bacteroidales bacterium]MDD2385328.1 cell division protein FtsZ [Bacteroidales bacterium]MDD4215773.1 cell division protein FtsZ [Bacteroidales bacterium]MDY0140380.1 cell division protein FtsZ [Bacteroidales bacterium]